MSIGNIEEVKRIVRNIVRKFDYEKRELNQQLLKNLKDLIKRDSQLIPEFGDAIFDILKSQDSDKRLCCVLLVDYFFQRSHAFRSTIIDSLQDFLVYTVELDPLYFPLPNPAQAAITLKKETLQIFKLWVEKFVDGYPKLENAKTILLSSQTFNFARSDGYTEVERRRAEIERARKDMVDKKIIEEVMVDFGDSKAHVKESITEVKTMISILIPDFREYNNGTSHGPSSSKTSNEPTLPANNLVIHVSDKVVLEKTDDNEELIRSLRDNEKLLAANLKKVNSWVSKMTKHGGKGDVLKEMLDMQRNLNQELRKMKDIKVVEKRKVVIPRAIVPMDESDDDDDFVEVNLNVADPEGLKIDEEEKEEMSVEQEMMQQIAEMEARETLNKVKKRKEPKNKKPEVPTLTYGLDLKYWGEEVEPADVLRNRADGHGFWRPPDDHEIGQESEEIYRSRIIHFVPELPDITRSCRAPLPSGRLCPRMDRYNCPLHGPIVDRDEHGAIVGNVKPGESSTQIQQAHAEYEKKRQEDEDDALYRELEEQTGGKFSYDLAKGKKKAEAPKKRVKSAHQKTRERLSTKLFNKRAIKRVTDTLDAIQKNKAAKKFAHQFNYS